MVSGVELAAYAGLLADIKSRIQAAQSRAVLAANTELIQLYWEIGHLLDNRQAAEGWGAAVIPRLASDIRNELPDVKGFSERNFKRMLAFFRAYQAVSGFGSQAVASELDGKGASKVPQPVAQMDATMLCAIPWGHHLLLMERVKDVSVRRWYVTQTAAEGWSRNTLALMIDGQIHERQGKLTNNFAQRLPAPHSGLVQQALKDPYVFDFLTPDECFHERKLETGLIRHLEKFLLELGQGFAFVGRQHKVTVADEDFFIDLLFYHLKLRCYLVIELKRGQFKPEHAGKLNFYCNVVDDKMRHASDAATIGLILCQGKDRVLAEYALRGIDKPIGIASYEFTRALPVTLRRVLPTIEAIEAELSAASKTAAS